jgi:purine-binding chemotaxis protein CheW
MVKKKKLESGLEGLFSKSSGKTKTPEKAAEEFIPTSSGSPLNNDKRSGEAELTPAAKPDLLTRKPETKIPEKAGKAPGKAKSTSTAAVKARGETPAVQPPVPVQEKDQPVVETVPLLTPAAKVPQPPIKPVVPTQPMVEPDSKPEDNWLANMPAVEKTLVVAEDTKGEEKQLLIFRIGDVDYAVEVELVQTIIKPQTVFLVPGTDNFVKGLINLRGEVVPVVDLHTRFNLPQQEKDKNTRFVVIEVGEIKASLIVDAVQGVTTIPVSSIEKPSNFVSAIETRYLKGIARLDNQLILILDVRQTIRVSVEN